MIEKWQEKHSSLLNEYTTTQKMMTEREICECRSHMKNVLDFIEELKRVKNNLVLADVSARLSLMITQLDNKIENTEYNTIFNRDCDLDDLRCLKRTLEIFTESNVR